MAVGQEIDFVFQVKRKPYFDVREYAFTRINGQQASGNLSASGAHSVTVSPVPAGLNGSDSNHWVYVSGGAGTAEPVLITGGTAVAGASSGTITFTTINSHSGAWIIGSATAGGQEALNVAIAAGPYRSVVFPPGSYTCYAPINGNGNSNISITGTRGATFINLPFALSALTETTAAPWTALITIGTGYFFVNSGSAGSTTIPSSDVNMSGGVYFRYAQSSMSVVVGSVPSDWAVGDFIGLQYQGWGVNGGQQEFHQIARIQGVAGNTISFDDPIVIPVAAASVNTPAGGGTAGHNQSLLTKLNLIAENSVAGIAFSSATSTFIGSVGGIGLFYTKDCSVTDIDYTGYANNGVVVMGYSWRPKVEGIRSYYVSGFSDVWLIGCTHARFAGCRSEYPSFGPGIWWNTFPTIDDIASTGAGAGIGESTSRGFKMHGCAWWIASNIKVFSATKTGLGIQGGSYNGVGSNWLAANSANPSSTEVAIYFSGEGNLNNKVTNVKALNGGGGSGIADAVIGAAFGFSDDYNKITNADFPGGWVDGGANNSVELSTNPASSALSGTPSITTATPTALAFIVSLFDYAGIHSTSTNNTRFTVPNSSQGVYEMVANVVWDANVTGIRTAQIYKNGVAVGAAIVSQGANASGVTGQMLMSELFLFGGDYIECFVTQTSGAGLAINTVQFTMRRVR